MSDTADGRGLRSVSHTRWSAFRECPRRAWLAYVDKVPEPDDPRGGASPLARGIRVHEACEAFLRAPAGAPAPFPPEAAAFEAPLRHLRLVAEGDPGALVVEQMWEFDGDWAPVSRPPPAEVWLRAKLDAFVFLDAARTAAVAVDFKTGKRFGNEVKHEEQAQVYALCAFRRFPTLKSVHAEFWYFDKALLHRTQYRWPAALRHFERWSAELRRVTDARTFPPAPSKQACRWCPFQTGAVGARGPEGTGHCDRNLVLE